MISFWFHLKQCRQFQRAVAAFCGVENQSCVVLARSRKERGVWLLLCMAGDKSWTGHGAKSVFVWVSLVGMTRENKTRVVMALTSLLCQHEALSSHRAIMFTYWDESERAASTGNYPSGEPKQSNLTRGIVFPKAVNARITPQSGGNSDISLFILLLFSFLPAFPTWQNQKQTFPPHAVS